MKATSQALSAPVGTCLHVRHLMVLAPRRIGAGGGNPRHQGMDRFKWLSHYSSGPKISAHWRPTKKWIQLAKPVKSRKSSLTEKSSRVHFISHHISSPPIHTL